MRPEQLYLADDLAPPSNPDIERSIDMWLEAKAEQKSAGETTKLRHATLLLHMNNAGIDAYPFTDPSTGKKKQVVIAREPKAKTLRAPRPGRRDDDVEIGDEVVIEDEATDDKVEHRKVKRASVESEIDPFGSTRAEMKPHANGRAPKKVKKAKR